MTTPTAKYFGLFKDRDSVAREFRRGTGSEWDKDDPFVIASDFPTDEQILLASYENESYEGSAYVLYRMPDGTLREVEGGHCSCNGLEGQWQDHGGLVTPGSLALRIKAWDEDGYDSISSALYHEAKDAYRRIVAALAPNEPAAGAPSTPKEK